MKVVMGAVLGFVAGILVLGIVGHTQMPGMMLKERVSPYGVEETVEQIKENALAEGWVVAGVKPLHQSVKKNGGGDLPPVMLVELCQARHAFEILDGDDNKVVATMMPCTISVYEKSDGRTYVGTMNAGLLGKMFGGTVAEVMGRAVAADQKKFIAFAD